MRSQIARAAAVVAALLLLASIAIALVGRSERLAGSNDVRATEPVARLTPGVPHCQPELVPGDTAALEVSTRVGPGPGPPLRATIRDRSGRVIARGRSAGGYRSGDLRVPVTRVARTVPGAKVCLEATGRGGPALLGTKASRHARLAFFRPGEESWLQLAPVIARRLAIAKFGPAGPWLLWAALGLAGLAAALGLCAGLSGARRAMLLIALAALLNGVAWSLVVPPFQAFDETVHVYYAQRLAVTGKVPRPIQGTVLPPEENAVMNLLRVQDVAGNPEAHPPWTKTEQKAIDALQGSHPGRVSDGADGGVGVYPPLYYAAGALAYKATPTDPLLDRVAVMRLVSAALAALTALFVCLFVRELLPRPEWAWRAAGVVAAFQPIFGFMSGVFNPDLGASAAAAGLLYGIARAYRRGLTPRLAAAIGLALAAGFLCKLVLAGFVPGAALAVLLAARRTRAWAAVGAFAVAAAAPVAAYVALNVTVWDRPALLGSSAPSLANAPPEGALGAAGGQSGSYLAKAFEYTWQVFLPRLPFMSERASGWPAWDRYFEGWVGRFGWGDYEFGAWVDAAVALTLAILLASAIALVLRHRPAFTARWAEWVSYAALALGYMALLSYSGYDYVVRTGGSFEQGRYLLPLHGLYAALVAAGLRGLGARAGPVVAAVLVVAAVGLSVWAQLLTVGRFYA